MSCKIEYLDRNLDRVTFLGGEGQQTAGARLPKVFLYFSRKRVSQVQPPNCLRRLKIIVLPSILTQIFHSWWCETCRVMQKQFWMKECDILGGQNYYDLSVIFSAGQDSQPPQNLRSRTCVVYSICLELTYVWRRLAVHRSSVLQRVESVERGIDELAACRHISGKPSHLGPPGLSVVRTSNSSTVSESPQQEIHPSGRWWSCSPCCLQKKHKNTMI